MADLTQEQIEGLQELLAKHKAESAPVQAQPAAAQPQGWDLDLGGQRYTVRNQDEAQRLFAQYQSQKEQEVEAERVRALAAEQRQQQYEQQLPQRQAQQGDEFSKEQYAKLFLDDPRKAAKYALQHDPEQIRFLSGIVAELATMKQEQATQQFLWQHRNDYEPTPENYKALETVIANRGLQWDLNGMNTALDVAKQMGMVEVESRQSAGQEQSEEEELQPVPVVAAPRVSRRRSSQNHQTSENAEIMAQFESLSPDAMKKYLESLA